MAGSLVVAVYGSGSLLTLHCFPDSSTCSHKGLLLHAWFGLKS